MERSRPRCILLVGYPAAGKSTYAEMLKQRGFTVISGDEVIRSVMEKYNLPSMDEAYERHRDEVNALMKNNIQEAFSRGDNVAIDALNTSRNRRKADIERAKKVSCRDYVFEAHVVYPPEETEHARRLVSRILYARSLVTTNGLFLNRLEHEYEPPTKDEGFDVIVEIGKKPDKPMMRM